MLITWKKNQNYQYLNDLSSFGSYYTYTATSNSMKEN